MASVQQETRDICARICVPRVLYEAEQEELVGQAEIGKPDEMR